MKPIDFSLMTFDEIRAQLNEQREQVHRAWLAHGPGTTRDVAAKSEIDLLTFRPRSTDLYQMGALALVDKDGNEGIYRARTFEQWEAYVAAQRLPANSQLNLAKL